MNSERGVSRALKNSARTELPFGLDSGGTDARRGRRCRIKLTTVMSDLGRRPCEVGRCGRILNDFAGAAGSRPASGEGKLELTKAPRSIDRGRGNSRRLPLQTAVGGMPREARKRKILPQLPSITAAAPFRYSNCNNELM